MSHTEQIGSVVGSYTLLSFLFSHPKGDIFLARHNTEETEVWLLLFAKEKSATIFDADLDGELVSMAGLLQKNHHPNALPLLHIHADAATQQIALVYAAPPFSQNLMMLRAQLKREQILTIFTKIAAFLPLYEAYDLSPVWNLQEILVDPISLDFRVILIPYVNTSRFEASSTRAGTFKAHDYTVMPPELIRGEGKTSASSFYATGIHLFEMLSGKRPFEGAKNELEILQQAITDPSAQVEDAELHPADKELLRELLQSNPQKRLRDPLLLSQRLIQGVYAETEKKKAPPRPAMAPPPAMAPLPRSPGATSPSSSALPALTTVMPASTIIAPSSAPAIPSPAPAIPSPAPAIPSSAPAPVMPSAFASSSPAPAPVMPAPSANLSPAPAPVPMKAPTAQKAEEEESAESDFFAEESALPPPPSLSSSLSRRATIKAEKKQDDIMQREEENSSLLEAPQEEEISFSYKSTVVLEQNAKESSITVFEEQRVEIHPVEADDDMADFVEDGLSFESDGGADPFALSVDKASSVRVTETPTGGYLPISLRHLDEETPSGANFSSAPAPIADWTEEKSEVARIVAEKEETPRAEKQEAATPVREADTLPQPFKFEELEEAEKARLVQEAPKMKEVKILRRKGVVRYYEQMNPKKIFPLLVSIIQAEMYIKIPDLPRVKQAESERVMEIKESSPHIRLVPVIPGCLISPPEAVVDVRAEKVDTTFWVSPLCEGDLTQSARVQIWHEGVMKDEIPIPTRIRTQTLTKIISSMSFLSSFAGALFDAYGKKLTAGAAAKAVKAGTAVKAVKAGTAAKVMGAGGVAAAPPPDDKTNLGGFLIQKVVAFLGSSGITLGVMLLIMALLCYWWLKPKRGEEIEHFLNTELH